jgi:hypothetical protein
MAQLKTLSLSTSSTIHLGCCRIQADATYLQQAYQLVQPLLVWPGVRCKHTMLCCHQLVRRREENMEHAGHVAQLIAFAKGLQRRCRPDDALRSDREVRAPTDCSNQMAGCDGDKGSIVRNNSGIVHCAVM